jgi:hypothetical protein
MSLELREPWMRPSDAQIGGLHPSKKASPAPRRTSVPAPGEAHGLDARAVSGRDHAPGGRLQRLEVESPIRRGADAPDPQQRRRPDEAQGDTTSHPHALRAVKPGHLF